MFLKLYARRILTASIVILLISGLSLALCLRQENHFAKMLQGEYRKISYFELQDDQKLHSLRDDEALECLALRLCKMKPSTGSELDQRSGKYRYACKVYFSACQATHIEISPTSNPGMYIIKYPFNEFPWDSGEYYTLTFVNAVPHRLAFLAALE